MNQRKDERNFHSWSQTNSVGLSENDKIHLKYNKIGNKKSVYYLKRINTPHLTTLLN